MDLAIVLLLAMLEPEGFCVEPLAPGDLLSQSNSGGSFGRRAALSILDLVEHEGDGRARVAIAYFFPETMSHSGHRGGPGFSKHPTSGCVEPWIHVFSDAWNLGASPSRPPADPAARLQANDPSTWTSALRFAARLDGRARTMEIGDTIYDLAEGSVFAVVFDDELRPEVHQTDSSLSDVPAPDAVRRLVIERLKQ